MLTLRHTLNHTLSDCYSGYLLAQVLLVYLEIVFGSLAFHLEVVTLLSLINSAVLQSANTNRPLLHPSWSLTIAMSSAASALLKAFHVKSADLLGVCWWLCMCVCWCVRVFRLKSVCAICICACVSVLGPAALSQTSYQMDVFDISAAKDFPHIHKQLLNHWQFALTEAHRWNSYMFRSSVSVLLCHPLSSSIFPIT